LVLGAPMTAALGDFLVRLQRAMPHVRDWMTALQAEHSGRATPVSELSLPRVPRYWPPALLKHAQAVTVDTIPFPPVATYGLPEFEGLAAMPMAGITFGRMYFIHAAHSREDVHFHELVHVVQWSTLGVDEFLLTYALGIAQHGYERSPFEAVAFEQQAAFEAGLDLPGLVNAVEVHATATRDQAADVFRGQGLRLSNPEDP
jgi:hypothetical protein